MSTVITTEARRGHLRVARLLANHKIIQLAIILYYAHDLSRLLVVQ